MKLLLALAGWAVQLGTATFVVVRGVGQLMVTQLFADDATCAVQLTTGLAT